MKDECSLMMIEAIGDRSPLTTFAGLQGDSVEKRDLRRRSQMKLRGE